MSYPMSDGYNSVDAERIIIFIIRRVPIHLEGAKRIYVGCQQPHILTRRRRRRFFFSSTSHPRQSRKD